MIISRTVPVLRHPSAATPLGAQLRAAFTIGSIVFASALLDIALRPAGFLAAVWPANALMLGLLVRRPVFATPFGWCAAALGHVAANLLGGTGLNVALLLMSGNLAGVITGYALFMGRDQADRRLRRPTSVLHLVVIVVAAATASAAVGPIVDPFLFGHTPADGWAYRFATELVNYVTLLPLVLTMPVPTWLAHERRRHAKAIRLVPEQSAPALALALSCIAGMWIGGPGAVAFPVPALLWGAVTYGQFGTAVLTFLFSIWTMVAIVFGHLIDPFEFDTQYALMSVRIGVALIALAPITVASVMAARNELLEQLRQLASHDPLTGVLNRRAFLEACRERQAQRPWSSRPTAVLVLDIDHFKKINDTFGHAVGDQVLATFARTVRECLRGGDLLGRFGGEEFVALMCGCTADEAAGVAERVRGAVAGTIVHVEGGRSVDVTVSIGVAAAGMMPPALEPLLAAADKALYAAKAAGRDRVARAA
jgi:diguanylate cyclase (GGDEF)-like protein